MSDLIDRQAAIEIVQQARIDTMDYGTPSLRKIEEEIETIPSAQQWIPCSERLPEEKSGWENVTVLDESGDIAFVYVSAGYYLNNGMWIVNNEPLEAGNLIRVIAWMPLPEPYKGE